MDWAAQSTKTGRDCLLAGTVTLGVIAIALLVAACVVTRPRRRVKAYYRGEGVRMASTVRKMNTRPQEYRVCTFSRVLPGSVSVRQYGTSVQTTADLRPFLRRGDPIKIGPQIFTVDSNPTRPFTDRTLPLDGPGRLEGPDAAGVTAYTCDQVNLPGNRWSGPRGGAIGYWDDKGKWQPGYCFGAAPHWYSPLFMGAACSQHEGPSPAVVARADEERVKAKVDTDQYV